MFSSRSTSYNKKYTVPNTNYDTPNTWWIRLFDEFINHLKAEYKKLFDDHKETKPDNEDEDTQDNNTDNGLLEAKLSNIENLMKIQILFSLL